MSTPDRLTDEEREALAGALDRAVSAGIAKAAVAWGMPLVDILNSEGHDHGCDAVAGENLTLCDCWWGRVRDASRGMSEVATLAEEAASVTADDLPTAVERILAARLAAQPPATDRDAMAEALRKIAGLAGAGTSRATRRGDDDERTRWIEVAHTVVDALAGRPAPAEATDRDALSEQVHVAIKAWFSQHRPANGWGASAQAWTDLIALVRGFAARPAPDTLVDRVQALLDRWARDGLVCGCGHELGEHNGFGCYAVLSYTPTRVSCTCKEDDDRHDVDFAIRDLRGLLAGRSDASPEVSGRCLYVSTDAEATRKPRDDGWRCGREEGHDGAHRLYSADGERVIYSASWERRAAAYPEGGEQRG